MIKPATCDQAITDPSLKAPAIKAPATYVIGSAGHASVVLDALQATGTPPVNGLIDDFSPPGTPKLGTRVLGSVAWLAEQAQRAPVRAIIAVGAGYARQQIVARLSATPIEWLTLIHPRAIVSPSATIGAGSFVAAGAVIGPLAKVGDHSLINHGAIIEHEVDLSEYTTVCPNATVCGAAKIGLASMIGAGAVVLEKRGVAEHTVIAAGAVVTQDIAANQIAIGSPAKAVKSRACNQAYFL